jgi:hypothetical protein
MALYLAKSNISIVGSLNSIATNFAYGATNTTITTGSNGQQFTAPNTTDQALGVVVVFRSKRVGGTFTAELLESGTPVASITINQDDIPTFSIATPLYLELAVPYTYTTTASNAYRWRFSASGGTGTTSLAQQTSVSGQPSTGSVSSVTGTPALGDSVYVCSPNGAGSVVALIDNTGTIGPTSPITALDTFTQDNGAIHIGAGGIVRWSSGFTGTFNISGVIYNYFLGFLDLSDNGTAIAGNLKFLTAGNQVLSCGVKSLGRSRIKGIERTLSARYVEGDGSTATPLTVDEPTDWQVDDYIAIAPSSDNASNWLETEYKYIRTVVSDTEFTLSDTIGGAESPLTNSRDYEEVPVCLFDYDFFIDTNSANNANTLGFFWHNARNTGGDDADYSYFHANRVGAVTSVSNHSGFTVYGFQSGSGLSNPTGRLANALVRNTFFIGFRAGGSAGQNSMTNIFAIDHLNNYGSGAPVYIQGDRTVVLDGCIIIDCARQGLTFFNATSRQVIDCELWGVNRNNISNGAFLISNAYVVCDNLNIHCSRQAIVLSTSNDSVFSNSFIGTKGQNESYIFAAIDTVVRATFILCNFAENATLINGASGMQSGSIIAFQNYNEEPNRHFFYTELAFFQQTGPDLPDTTLVVAGASTLSCEPYAGITESAYYDFEIPTIVSNAVQVAQQLMRNSSYDGTITYELYYPNEDPNQATPEATTTLSSFPASVVQAATLGYQYLGTENSVSVLRVKISPTSAGGIVYLGPFYNQRTIDNPPASLASYRNGLPTRFITQNAGSPADFWNYLQEFANIQGTMGYLVRQIMKFLKLFI